MPPALVNTLRWLPLVLLGALLAYVIVAKPFDWRTVWNHIVGLSPWLWGQLLLMFLVGYGARIWRWAVFTHAVGAVVPLWRNAVIYMAGFGLGLVLHKPGEAMRALYLKPYGMGYAEGVGAFLADRLLDIFVAGLLACFGIFLFSGHSDWALMATGVCLCAIWVLRSSLARKLVQRMPLGRLSVYAQDGMHAMALLLSGKTLWKAGALSVLTWCAQGSALYFALRDMGASVDWTMAVSVYAVGLFAGAAAIVPGGMGAAEATIMLLLTAKGVDKEAALAAAVVGRGFSQWLGMFTGLVAMAFVGKMAEPALEPLPQTTPP